MSSALTLETLQPILSNPEFLEKVKDFVPKDESAGKDVSAEDLKGTVLSPQFKQVHPYITHPFIQYILYISNILVLRIRIHSLFKRTGLESGSKMNYKNPYIHRHNLSAQH